MSKVVRAAGAVLWRRPLGADVEVAVVHRPHYDDWSLPKGKLDAGETSAVAAAREVTEETGYEPVLDRFLTVVEYTVGSAGKTVEYFAARAVAGGFLPNAEVDELRWLPLARARELLSYDTDVRVLDVFAARQPDLTTLLLVRHAKAGNRENWTGDDDLRPLSDAGVRQARALRVLLRAFRPDRVVSAPRLRCVQTVQSVADDAGVEVELEPRLSEEGYASDPVEGLALLRALAATGGTPVVCSQGGAIPGLVATLAEQDGVEVQRKKSGEVPSKKGSAWLLSFDADARLVSAHYLSSPLPEPVTSELTDASPG
ncbi:NUDIX hydrolase [Saccharomonospora saliphila]|uniref:NUDIX hydrolase n=1 Tax=Saccharomonospora saliphila TaxID=369829 RepID=UPI000490983D|nr:NUDIX hydrolase [Saccharomonospora saliphila]